MTARIIGRLRPSVAYGNAEVRQRRIDTDRAIGIRDTEGDTNARAEQRLWGRARPTRANGNRRVAAVGQIDPAWGTLGWGETYANEDGDVFRWYPLDDGGPTIVRGPNY